MRTFTVVALVSFACETCLVGCLARQQCPNEHSYSIAMQILDAPRDTETINKIEACEDVDALRIIAFAAHSAAWPMEAGSNGDFDNRLDSLSLVALRRLFSIDSEAARDSIDYYKRTFGIDGAYSLCFRKWEEEKRTLKVTDAKPDETMGKTSKELERMR